MGPDQGDSSRARPAAVSSAELLQAVLPLQPQASQHPPSQAPVQESRAVGWIP